MRAKVRHFRLSQLSTLNSQLASPSSRLHRISRSTGILPVGPTDILSVASVTAGYKPAGPEPNDWPMGSRIQLQQRNCSRFARDFSRRSTFSSSQRTGSRTSRLRSALQDLFTRAVFMKSSQQMLSLRELLLQTTPTFFVADH